MKHSRVIMSCLVAALLVAAFLAIPAQGQERPKDMQTAGEKYSLYSGQEKFKKVDLYFQTDAVCSSGSYTTIWSRYITTKNDSCILVRVSGEYYATSGRYTDLWMTMDGWLMNGPTSHAADDVHPDYRSEYTANWWVCGLAKGQHYISFDLWPYDNSTYCLQYFNVEVWY